VAILAAGITKATAQDDKYYGGFDGRWEGTMSHVSLPAFDNPEVTTYIDAAIAFTISGNKAKVFFKVHDDWQEIKAGTFQILGYKTNAVLFSITSSGDLNSTASRAPNIDGWIETWNFTITHKAADSLFVTATRAVNNYPKPYDYKFPQGGVATFFRNYSGELTKVPD
jgi:hypothetical protein